MPALKTNSPAFPSERKTRHPDRQRPDPAAGAEAARHHRLLPACTRRSISGTIDVRLVESVHHPIISPTVQCSPSERVTKTSQTPFALCQSPETQYPASLILLSCPPDRGKVFPCCRTLTSDLLSCPVSLSPQQPQHQSHKHSLLVRAVSTRGAATYRARPGSRPSCETAQLQEHPRSRNSSEAAARHPTGWQRPC